MQYAPMARPLRPELAEGLYRLTSRGDGREDIHLSDNDRADRLAAITGHQHPLYEAEQNHERV
jgi:hypothetical protein